MDINRIIKDLQANMDLEFEQRAIVFKRYEKILQNEIKINPRDIKATTLLAMVKFELRKSTRVSIKCLEKAYSEQKDLLSDDEYSLLATNLAYFYIEECAGKEELARKLLKSSVERNSPYAQTYFSLAMLYYKSTEYKLALPLFKKAHEIDPLFRYKFNYAICLYKIGDISESIEILKILSQDYESNEYKTKAYYSVGAIYAAIGEFELVRKIAFDLLNIDYQKLDIEGYWLADLMFVLDEFERYINLYDNINMHETADWLSAYFYSLKSLNQLEKASKKFCEINLEINKEIDECSLEDFDGNQKDMQDYVKRETDRLNSIKSAYEDVFKYNIKPKCNFEIYPLYGCYYINCPRHSLDDFQGLET